MVKKNKQFATSKEGPMKAEQSKCEDTTEKMTANTQSSPRDTTGDSTSFEGREKHNKKSVRPPVLFHREFDEPHGYLSQWYISSFTDPSTGQTYNCAEQYMMHQKAVFHHDDTTAASILATPYPKDQKALGRCVANWDEDAWNEIREKIVEEGNYLKFSHNKELRDRLLLTGERELVEASASDRVWGVGFNAKEALSRREEWGTNLLGKCLMRARERIKEDGRRDL
ncbi:hypothetical protein QM012_008049 [Aureobasidium pullulans]|uniref:NADAR domain-containing protein n=1 Tax=Aureobasidium pullulans TaxID=5580 RepID=A0ABR0TMZ5_AURPU